MQRPVNVKCRPRLPIPDDEDPYSIAGNNCVSNDNSDSSGYSGSSNSNGKKIAFDYNKFGKIHCTLSCLNDDLIKTRQYYNNCIYSPFSKYQRNDLLRILLSVAGEFPQMYQNRTIRSLFLNVTNKSDCLLRSGFFFSFCRHSVSFCDRSIELTQQQAKKKAVMPPTVFLFVNRWRQIEKMLI